MKLSKLISFCVLFSITTSCSNTINQTTPINNEYSSMSDGVNLINAIKSNNVEKVKELLSKNINLKVQNSNGETPLMIASANGNKEIVELICNNYKLNSISKPLDFNWKKPKSYVEVANPILYSYNKYTDYSDDYNSFINYTNSKSFNKSALLFAIENGHTDIAKYLISEGSDLSVKDSNQNNLIFYSLILRNTEFIDKVISKNKNSINEKDIYGNTPLMVASFLGDLEMVQYLISKGAYINEKNNFGNTAIMLASGCNYNKFYDFSTQNDIKNSDIIDNFEKTINLIYLKSKNKNKPFSVYKDIINLLIKNNADLNSKNNSNITPFILGSMYGNKDILDFMISKGAKLFESDNFGSNALLYSAKSGNIETFKYLISKGLPEWLIKKLSKRIFKIVS